MAEVKATFRSALDRMEEFPNYRFTCACACYYEWVEQNEPAMFEEIRRRVKEGRWIIAGGWYIQPDCNIPSGESLARQGLYSQRYFKEKFGVTAKTGYNVDTFGHGGMLPQILKKSGMDYYVFMRPMKHEKELPSNLFQWQSADGSSVTVFRIPVSYVTRIDEERERLFGILQEAEEAGTDYMGFYGVGNHGGGPTVAVLSIIEGLMKEQEGKFIYSSPDDYFQEVRELTMPVIEGDLQHHARGCYSAHAQTKMNNRRAEHILLTAEKINVLSNILFQTEYPYKEFLHAWKGVMFNQFHDILGGCSLKEAYDDAAQLYGEALSIGARQLNFAFQKISWHIDTTNGLDITPEKAKISKFWETDKLGTPVVLFNPLSWEVQTDISCGADAKFITDNDGNVVNYQKSRASQTNQADKYETRFDVTVPAFGYAVYRLHMTEQDILMPPGNEVIADNCQMENEYVKIVLDQSTGCILKLYDKKENRDVLNGLGSVGRVIDETHCDTWAHDVASFQDEVGRFANAKMKLIESGPVRSVIRVTSYFNRSELRQDFIVYANDPQIDVKVRLDWREAHKMLKLSFPVNICQPRVINEIAYGCIEKQANGEEEPCQQWVDLFGQTADGGMYGLGLLNDSKYGYDANGSTVSLTVIRGSVFADHFGERDELCELMDQGIHEFSYALIPHKGDFKQAGIVKRAYELNCKPQHIVETFHKGKMPCRFTGITITAENIIASALKCSEDGQGYILRCYETDGVEASTDISLFQNRKWTAHFSPFEIKTFYIPQEFTEPIRETNLIEL